MSNVGSVGRLCEINSHLGLGPGLGMWKCGGVEVWECMPYLVRGSDSSVREKCP